MAKGLLIAGFDFSGVPEDEFNDWYDTEHIPERTRVPGFLSLERWLGAEDPRISLATYDLETLAVLRSDPYLAIAYDNLSPWSKRLGKLCKRVIRFEGEQTLPGDAVAPPGAGALLINAMNVDPAGEQDFNRWYDEEHIPALAAVPGVLAARRFVASSTTLQKYVALYHLESPAACSSDAWTRAVETPWTERVRPHMRDRLRIVLRRYQRAA